jgi:hypothetical protein
MIEVTCQTCGAKAGVQSFLGAAQQPCGHCGQFLMGPLERGTRIVRPSEFGEVAPSLPPLPVDGRGSSARLWLGVFLGALAGVGLVVAVARMGPVIPLTTRGAVLGALTGVLFAPVLVISSFISMLVFPFSLEGILGDSLWNRLAKALHERRPRYLLLPILFFVVLPMTVGALGGSKVQNPASLVASASLGAVLLGAIGGGVCGTVGGKPQ